MAEAGIKISQLSNVTKTNDNDYTVLVHDGITCRAALSAIKNSFDSDSELDAKKLNEVIEQAKILSNSVNGLCAEYNSLSDNFLSNSLSTQITSMYWFIYGDGDENPGVNVKLTDLSNIVQDLSTSVGVLTDDNVVENIDNLLAALSDDSGDYSLSNMAENIVENTNNIDELRNAVGPIVSQLEVQEKQQQAILIDSVDNYAYTSLNNLSSSESLNPLNAIATNDNYNFYYDENRFANIAMPKISFYVRGYVVVEGGEDILTTFTILSDDFPGNTYISGDNTELTGISVISAEGISASNNSFVSVLIENGTTTSSDVVYLGKETFASEYGIPLRYGMFKIETNEDTSSITVFLNIETQGLSKAKLYLNRSSFINGYYSYIDVYINGKLIGGKRSGKNLVEDYGDLEEFYDCQLDRNSVISFRIEKIKNDSGELQDLYSVIGDKTTDNTLFGMIIPMATPSQFLEMELGNFTVNNNGDSYSLEGNVFYGIKGSQIEVSAFYLDEDSYGPSDLDGILNEYQPSSTFTVALNNNVVNEYRFDGVSAQKYVYVFAKNDRTGEILYPNNNGLFVGENLDTSASSNNIDESTSEEETNEN